MGMIHGNVPIATIQKKIKKLYNIIFSLTLVYLLVTVGNKWKTVTFIFIFVNYFTKSIYKKVLKSICVLNEIEH